MSYAPFRTSTQVYKGTTFGFSFTIDEDGSPLDLTTLNKVEAKLFSSSTNIFTFDTDGDLSISGASNNVVSGVVSESTMDIAKRIYYLELWLYFADGSKEAYSVVDVKIIDAESDQSQGAHDWVLDIDNDSETVTGQATSNLAEAIQAKEDAKAAAAGVSLPIINTADVNKQIIVNNEGEWELLESETISFYQWVLANGGIVEDLNRANKWIKFAKDNNFYDEIEFWGDVNIAHAKDRDDKISAIFDLGPNHNDLLQDTSSKQPVLNDGFINKRAVLFDGVDDGMSLPSDSSVDGATLFYAIRSYDGNAHAISFREAAGSQITIRNDSVLVSGDVVIDYNEPIGNETFGDVKIDSDGFDAWNNGDAPYISGGETIAALFGWGYFANNGTDYWYDGDVASSLLVNKPLSGSVRRKLRYSYNEYYEKGYSDFYVDLTEESASNPVLTKDDVNDVNADFVADPFIFKDDGTYHAFFEIKVGSTQTIGHAESNDGLSWTYNQEVLSESGILFSYPYVFKHDGEYYMLPMTSGSKSCELYKAVNFPIEWEKEETLFSESYDLRDPTIFQWDDKWWVIYGDNFESPSNINIRYSETLLNGNWIEHDNNPVVSGDALRTRPAGNAIVKEDKIITFFQDQTSSSGTGKKVTAWSITDLTASTFSMTELYTSPVLYPKHDEWAESKMHHVSIIEDDGIAIVDGYSSTTGEWSLGIFDVFID